MPNLKDGERYTHYKCGKCKGKILYLENEGPPEVCPECGYSYKAHGTRDYHDAPSELRLDLNNPSNSDDASRGITEQSTITSR